MRVAMIGAGYVGLVSGACFADFGHVVTCIDKDVDKIERLKTGGIPIFEPGLESLVAKNVREGRLFFDADAAENYAVTQVEVLAIRGKTLADLRCQLAGHRHRRDRPTRSGPGLGRAE